jgi:hypothetical protein
MRYIDVESRRDFNGGLLCLWLKTVLLDFLCTFSTYNSLSTGGMYYQIMLPSPESGQQITVHSYQQSDTATLWEKRLYQFTPVQTKLSYLHKITRMYVPNRAQTAWTKLAEAHNVYTYFITPRNEIVDEIFHKLVLCCFACLIRSDTHFLRSKIFTRNSFRLDGYLAKYK